MGIARSTSPPTLEGEGHGRPYSSIRLEPGKEAGISSLLQSTRFETALCSALPPEKTDPGEELPGLPSAVYLKEMEDPWTTEPYIWTMEGSIPGKLTLVRFGCW